jgi:hypothetical protein
MHYNRFSCVVENFAAYKNSLFSCKVPVDRSSSSSSSFAMDGEYTSFSIRNSPVKTNVVVKGLLRGMIVGMVFSSIIAYVGVVDFTQNDDENSVAYVSSYLILTLSECEIFLF